VQQCAVAVEEEGILELLLTFAQTEIYSHCWGDLGDCCEVGRSPKTGLPEDATEGYFQYCCLHTLLQQGCEEHRLRSIRLKRIAL
jgi:hypothetical protein